VQEWESLEVLATLSDERLTICGEKTIVDEAGGGSGF
jgi:hypothetical protein